MQTMFSFGQSAALRTIQDRLRGVFGPIRDAKRLDPLSQFVRSFLGSKTYDRRSWDAFLRLTQTYKSWEAVADAPVQEVEETLRHVTFAEAKAADLVLALQKIRARAGTLNLDFLAGLAVPTALVWLEQIHGVGRKIAAATLNFSSLRKRAFVVDTHVLRVMQRFGFVKPNADNQAVYDAVMSACESFDADDLYELHWYLKGLGQKTCMPYRAHCETCALSDLCLKRVQEDAVAVTRSRRVGV
ncbi:MAG: endonuclease III [Proteobacteria bacterium]|nr:endonuclease III [Pseudomonadota bacterium]